MMARADRQAAPALDDADQIGIGQIVIGLAVAGQFMAPGNDGGEQ